MAPCPLMSTTNRATALAANQMQTGRDYLQGLLHRFRQAEDDMWSLRCKGTIHRKNVCTCFQLDGKLSRSGYYWEVQCRMAQKLRVDIVYKKLKKCVDSLKSLKYKTAKRAQKVF